MHQDDDVVVFVDGSFKAFMYTLVQNESRFA